MDTSNPSGARRAFFSGASRSHPARPPRRSGGRVRPAFVLGVALVSGTGTGTGTGTASAEGGLIDAEEIVRALSAPRTRSAHRPERGIGGVREGRGEDERRATGAAGRQFSNILFEPGSARIESASKPQLDELGRALRWLDDIEPTTVFVIEGHTDSIGDERVNAELSTRRAETIRRYLAERFALPDDRLLVVGLGESRPIAANDTERGRALNRRVVVARKN